MTRRGAGITLAPPGLPRFVPSRRLSRPAAFWSVAVLLVLMLAASGVPSPLYRVYQAEFGFSSGVLTTIFGIYSFALLASLLVVGALSDHVGRRPVLVAAFLLETVAMVLFLMSDANVAMQMQRPWMKFGTDASGLDPEKERTSTHPRAYGTYPRILGKYVREDRVLTLEDAVRKMTSAVATRLAIPDRGVLRAGMRADVVVFDPNTIIDRATFEKPHQLSEGVRDVYVNGVATVRAGRVTGATPGMIVRGAGYARP